MSRYWAGDGAWTNPPLQALPRRREGSGGGLEYGSGVFDVISQSWSYLTASDTLNEAVTLGRVWVEAHDRTIFEQVWEELDASLPFSPDARFYSRGSMGVPEAPHLSKDDHDRIQGFVHLESPQVVEDFKVWIANIPDPDGAITRRWKRKQLHLWLLPAMISCLSRIPLNDWYTMPATTNLGEAEHARNAETGTQMGIIESFKKYAEYDARRAAEINIKLATGNLNNNQNELVHRYASSNRRHAAATDKGTRARDADERGVALRQAKAQVEAELKQATAEAKSNSSGRVPARRPAKGKKQRRILKGRGGTRRYSGRRA
ncbi:hypothetical protein B0H13DRAFT_1877706 [Mycena leptocephala]|nr:hypothetical protein B0H13DRAFT_1877706 [Mycena leptocephala]